MGTYLEQYEYDEVGNFLNLIHRGTDPAHAGWTRAYTYNETSQLERSRKSNRVTRTAVGSLVEAYSIDGDGYDLHGNMLHMPHLEVMQWDFKDQLFVSQRQEVDDQDQEGIERQGERTYYLYDATGQRVRKVTERQNGTRKEERIYLGGFELYRKYGNDGVALSLEWETLHIMDDQRRIALVETKSRPAPLPFFQPEQLIRFQFTNHLGTATLELDDDAIDISYEEYYPYGSTAYQAVRNRVKVPKRYRYTGKERDEESGLYYHGARYYVSWLGRWTSCDPSQRLDGTNLYWYGGNNPLKFIDPDGRAINLAAAGVGALIGGVGGAVIGAWNAKPGERWSAAAKGGAIGVGVGALAGLTFGASLAVTGAAGIGGTAIATGATTTTGSVLVSATVAGAVSGGAGAATSTLVEGGSGQEAWERATVGAFTGAVGGAVGGGAGGLSTELAKSAGYSNFASNVLGGVTGGATGDVASQTVSIMGGVQEEFSVAQVLVATAGGGIGAGAMSKIEQAKINAQQAKAERFAAVRETLATVRAEAAAELAARDLYMQIRRTGSNNLKNKTKVIVGMADRTTRKVTAERNGQKGLGPATDKNPVLDRALETCGENANAVRAAMRGQSIGNGENVTFFAIEANPTMKPKAACLNCQAQFPNASFSSGRK
jgi:RHS repeat-associated protein